MSAEPAMQICPTCGISCSAACSICPHCNAALAHNLALPEGQFLLSGNLGNTPAFLNKIPVSEDQQALAGLLEQITRSEGAPNPLREPYEKPVQPIWRILAALCLIIPIIAVLIFGGLHFDRPVASSETLNASRLVQNLQPGDKVLLGLDYQPAYTAEMEAAGTSLISHLIHRQASLALLTTVPTGRWQAQRLFEGASRQAGQLDLADYTYAGFFPGGVSGIRAFISDPRRYFPLNLPASHPFQDITRLADFNLVVVMTHSADKAREWIEQLRAVLEDKPLVLVVSAQAAPLVRPYYLSAPPTVQGIISGLPGGVTYENDAPTFRVMEGLASRWWNTFGLSIWIAAGLILFGAAWNAYRTGDSKPRPAGRRERKP